MFTGGVAQRLRHTLGKRTGAIPRRFESCLLRHNLQMGSRSNIWVGVITSLLGSNFLAIKFTES